MNREGDAEHPIFIPFQHRPAAATRWGKRQTSGELPGGTMALAAENRPSILARNGTIQGTQSAFNGAHGDFCPRGRFAVFACWPARLLGNCNLRSLVGPNVALVRP